MPNRTVWLCRCLRPITGRKVSPRHVAVRELSKPAGIHQMMLARYSTSPELSFTIIPDLIIFAVPLRRQSSHGDTRRDPVTVPSLEGPQWLLDGGPAALPRGKRRLL